MTAPPLTPELIAEIERLCLEGMGDRPIARQLKISVHKVRKFRPEGCLTERQASIRAMQAERGWNFGGRPVSHSGREDKLLTALQRSHPLPR